MNVHFLKYTFITIFILTGLQEVFAQPFPNSGNQSVCLNAIEPYGVINTPGSTYVWQIIPLTGGNGTISGSGSSINITWTNTGNCTLQVTETNAAGCSGTPVTIQVTVNPIPNVVATPASQTICSAAATAINLSGAVPGTTFAWTVAESPAGSVTGMSGGSGNMIGQTLINTTAIPATVTYTVTPTANGCVGLPIDVVITVNPTPVLTSTPASQTICSAGTTGISFSGPTPGTTYSWTTSVSPAGSITGAFAGSGNNIFQTLVNTTPDPATVTYSVTPSANGCPGLPVSVPVLVNPTPVAIATPAVQTICSGAVSGIALSSATAGTTYAWTFSVFPAGSVTGAAAGSGSNIAQTLINTTPGIATVTYRVTPTANGCTGAPIAVVVTVNPTPVVMASPAAQTICSQATTSVALSSTTAGTTFAWTFSVSPAGSITGASGGAGNLIAQTLTNTTPNPAVVTYTITPTANGCPGLPVSMNVTVNPTPNVVATPASQAICSNTSTAIALSGATAGTTFAWTFAVSPPGSVTGASSGTGNLINQILLNSSANPATVTYSITPTANGCAGLPVNVIVTVNPLPVPVISGPTPVCLNTSGNVYTTDAGMTSYIWSISGGVITSGQGTSSITVTWNTSGTGNVSVTYTNGNGCKPAVPTLYPVVVLPLPVPTITGPAPVCLNSAGNTYITENGMSNYVWTITGGTITSGSNTNSIVVTWNSAGTQNITVTYTDTNGCVPSSPTAYPVLINVLPSTSPIYPN